MAVFAATATTGALLAGAATADDHPGRHRSVASVDATATSTPALSLPDRDPHRYAYSLVYSGTTALAVSVTGMIIVGRRRRCW